MREFDIVSYGAVGDGKTVNTKAKLYCNPLYSNADGIHIN